MGRGFSCTHYKGRPLGWKPMNVTLLSMFSRHPFLGISLWTLSHVALAGLLLLLPQLPVYLQKLISVPLLNHKGKTFFICMKKRITIQTFFFIKIVKIMYNMLRFYDGNKNPLCSLTNTNKTIVSCKFCPSLF